MIRIRPESAMGIWQLREAGPEEDHAWWQTKKRGSCCTSTDSFGEQKTVWYTRRISVCSLACTGLGQTWPQQGNICHTVHRLLISWEERNSPKDVSLYLLLHLHRTGCAISSPNLVLNLHFPSYICWMHFPQNTLLRRPTFPCEWRICKLPVALISAVTG